MKTLFASALAISALAATASSAASGFLEPPLIMQYELKRQPDKPAGVKVWWLEATNRPGMEWSQVSSDRESESYLLKDLNLPDESQTITLKKKDNTIHVARAAGGDIKGDFTPGQGAKIFMSAAPQGVVVCSFEFGGNPNVRGCRTPNDNGPTPLADIKFEQQTDDFADGLAFGGVDNEMLRPMWAVMLLIQQKLHP